MWETPVTALSLPRQLPPPVGGIRRAWEPGDTTPQGLHLPQGVATEAQMLTDALVKQAETVRLELHGVWEGGPTVFSGETEAQRIMQQGGGDHVHRLVIRGSFFTPSRQTKTQSRDVGAWGSTTPPGLLSPLGHGRRLVLGAVHSVSVLVLPLTVCPWASHIASLGLSFIICEVGINPLPRLNENLPIIHAS